ncbi:hypothetical protein CPB83DRAFT_904934 [Crepidotus variabilis]|uniref:Uncharacterized protein n=1 Tax=Crepidotus variabilis TaxID=179855 RepID=A0A9P6ELA9_9AGAR|nr:hypothetical protein CPB83DRAFT_904934 [Crepidotus variabilis]
MDTDRMIPLTLSLPPELRQHVLRYACILSTSFCVALSNLSSWTRTLALPYLYTTIVVKKYAMSASFWLAISKPLPVAQLPDFRPSACVKSLWIAPVSNTIVKIFSRCENIVNFALPAENLHWLVHSTSMEPLTTWGQRIKNRMDYQVLVLEAKRATWSLAHLADETQKTPFFDAVTHLRIAAVGSYSTHLELAHFKRLSHIAIPYHRPDIHNLPDLLRIFDFPATIFLVVVLVTDQISSADYQSALDWVLQIRTTNQKVYVLDSHSENLQEEWEDEVRGGLDIWERAEKYTLNLTS